MENPNFAKALSRRATSLLFMALVLASAGCATGNAMKDSDRASIKTVYVRPDVTLHPQMHFQQRGAGMGAAFGIAGAVAEGAARQPATPEQTLAAMSVSPGVDVGEVLRQSFVREANARSSIRFVTDASVQADAELALKANLWGFGRTHLLGEALHPMFNVQATMQKRDGSQVWSRTDYVTPLNELNKEGYKIEDMTAQPTTLAKAYRQGADLVARFLASGLPPK